MAAKFRILAKFPIGVWTVTRARELVETQRAVRTLEALVGPGVALEVIPDSNACQAIDRQREEAEAALAAAVAFNQQTLATFSQDVGLESGLEGGLAEQAPGEEGPASRERRACEAQQAAGDELPWLLDRVCLVIAASLAWCWWGCHCLAVLVRGEERRRAS
jgi:hypothetical protein